MSLPTSNITKSQSKIDNSQKTGMMDENNKKMLKIFQEQGAEVACKKMFEHPTEKNTDGITTRQMSYAEMRSFYG